MHFYLKNILSSLGVFLMGKNRKVTKDKILCYL